MMPAFGDNSLANLPELRSIEEVKAVVLALDEAAERRYSALSRELRTFGSPEVAALLEELGGQHGDHGGRIAPKAASGKQRDLSSKDPTLPLPQILSEEDAATCDLLGLTPYRVLALAVTLAQQSFRLYSYLAAAAEGEVRDYAQQLASDELSRAARLRVGRRRAYHAGRRQADAQAYPAAPLVESQADLLAAALAIEDRLAERLAAAGEEAAEEEAADLSSACQATRQRVERLRDAAEQAGEPGGPMADDLARFSLATPTKARADQGRPAAMRHLLADCERAFSFYDAVASAPIDEAVMLQAQDLCRAAVERILQVRGSGKASDEAGRPDGNP